MVNVYVKLDGLVLFKAVMTLDRFNDYYADSAVDCGKFGEFTMSVNEFYDCLANELVD